MDPPIHQHIHGSIGTQPTFLRDILVVGDLAHFEQLSGQPLAGVAPVAIQEGPCAARLILSRLRGKTLPPSVYKDHGTMATNGRGAAIVNWGRLQVDGPGAWLMWLVVHLLYIVDVENRLLVLMHWAWAYFTRNRSARLIAHRLKATSRDGVEAVQRRDGTAMQGEASARRLSEGRSPCAPARRGGSEA